jgi:hypothetical protein
VCYRLLDKRGAAENLLKRRLKVLGMSRHGSDLLAQLTIMFYAFCRWGPALSAQVLCLRSWLIECDRNGMVNASYEKYNNLQQWQDYVLKATLKYFLSFFHSIPCQAFDCLVKAVSMLSESKAQRLIPLLTTIAFPSRLRSPLTILSSGATLVTCTMMTATMKRHGRDPAAGTAGVSGVWDAGVREATTLCDCARV